MEKRKIKAIKDNLKHINDCYAIFKLHAESKGITTENQDEYIKLLLKAYIKSDSILYLDDFDGTLESVHLK